MKVQAYVMPEQSVIETTPRTETRSFRPLVQMLGAYSGLSARSFSLPAVSTGRAAGLWSVCGSGHEHGRPALASTQDCSRSGQVAPQRYQGLRQSFLIGSSQ